MQAVEEEERKLFFEERGMVGQEEDFYRG